MQRASRTTQSPFGDGCIPCCIPRCPVSVLGVPVNTGPGRHGGAGEAHRDPSIPRMRGMRVFDPYCFGSTESGILYVNIPRLYLTLPFKLHFSKSGNQTVPQKLFTNTEEGHARTHQHPDTHAHERVTGWNIAIRACYVTFGNKTSPARRSVPIPGSYSSIIKLAVLMMPIFSARVGDVGCPLRGRRT